MSNKKTHNEYVNDLAIKNPNIEVIDKYIDAKTPIKHRCKIHNISWNISPSNALKCKGCKKCKSEKISNAFKKSHLQYVEDLLIYNPNIEVIENYINSKTPILHRCKIHDYIWSAYPYNILEGKGCPYCKGDKIRENLVWSHEDYLRKLEAENPNIEPIENYVNMNIKIQHRCKIDGTEWMMSPNAILNQKCGCPQCNKKKKTHKEYVAELFNINPNIEVVEEYKGSNVAILHRCLIDGYTWKTTPGHTVRGTGCPKCGGSLKYTNEDFVSRILYINPDVEAIEEYNGVRNKISFRCKIDGYIWKARPDKIIEGDGCPMCQESSGERCIRQWLERNNINYKYQYTFDACKDKRVLPFDFYLPDYDICIEYDGQQHFEPIDFSGRGDIWALEQLKTTQYHDKIKNTYCQINNIRLLRISYLQDVEEELNQNFSFEYSNIYG